jgi:hypothetical protein
MSAESDEALDKLLGIIADPVRQAEGELYEENRTDPYRWYCRKCGAEGEATEASERDSDAYSHVEERPCGVGPTLGTAASGHLLHLWSY